MNTFGKMQFWHIVIQEHDTICIFFVCGKWTVESLATLRKKNVSGVTKEDWHGIYIAFSPTFQISNPNYYDIHQLFHPRYYLYVLNYKM